MDVILAKNAGACYGVNRSLEIVKKHSCQNKKIATLGELIHNPIVVSDLKTNHNIISVDSLDEAIKLGIDVLIIRSHGVPISLEKKAAEHAITLVDATCPYVKNVQTTSSVLAGLYPAVLIIGKLGHPEVESVASYIQANGAACFIADSLEQVSSFLNILKSYDDVIGVVSQTTQSASVFDEIIKFLKDNNLNIEIENTICAATKKRQESATLLSKEVDAFVVVGGKNSSNTTHLADLCKNNCKKTFHIESLSEIDSSQFKGCKKIGLTAGASTPQSQIEPVLSWLRELE